MHREVAVVVASYNTRADIARLVFSLYRFLGPTEFGRLVVVDNGSSDGSLELLHGLQEARLLHLIENGRQDYHGPAISRGVCSVAEVERQRDREEAGEQTEYVWVIDSDVVVLRADTVSRARSVLAASGAAAVGQAAFDPWQKRVLLLMCSFMFDPAQLWQPEIPPFEEHGDPCLAMQLAAERRGLRLMRWRYVEDGYIAHVGCRTLASVAAGSERDNRYYKWAVENQDAHFEGSASARRRYSAFCEIFEAATGDGSVDSIIAACAGEPLSLDAS